MDIFEELVEEEVDIDFLELYKYLESTNHEIKSWPFKDAAAAVYIQGDTEKKTCTKNRRWNPYIIYSRVQ